MRRLIRKKTLSNKNNQSHHWFEKVEDRYGTFIKRLLPFKRFIFLAFIVLLIGSVLLIKFNFKYVMFPHEETRDITVSGSVKPGAKRYETAKLTKEIEDVIASYLGKEVGAMLANTGTTSKFMEIRHPRTIFASLDPLYLPFVAAYFKFLDKMS